LPITSVDASEELRAQALQRAKALVSSYPERLAVSTKTHLIATNGERLLIDDGVVKTHKQKLDAADVEDSLSQIYPAGCPQPSPPANFEPGRIRSQKLLNILYGSTREEVERTLVPVEWFGRTVRITRLHGAAAALERVRQRLLDNASVRDWLSPSGGTYNWRYIAGTKRRSMHSYGAAIDLRVSKARYWKWDKRTRRARFVPDSFPASIVSAFEKEGFIWGGRWFHYDSMHFEFRPELTRIGWVATDGGRDC
jgi:hypothetical protein